MQRRDCLRALVALSVLSMQNRVSGVARAGDSSAMNRIRDLHRGAWLTTSELLARLYTVPALVVGERHDNPEHHRRERWLMARLAERKALGGVAMEMLDNKQGQALVGLPGALLSELPESELKALLGWQSGWDWQAYGPTLRQALRLGVAVRGANLPHQRIGEIVTAGQAPALPMAVAQAQRQALIEGHCGLLPEAMLDGMLAAQVARDRAMAEALAELPATAMLICGNGHARRDIGVALHAEHRPLCLGLVELGPGQHWTAVLPNSSDEGPPFDLVWFTPATGRNDPCAALHERFAE